MIELEFIVISGPDTGRAYPFPSAHFQLGSAEGVGACVTGPEVQPRHVEVEIDGQGVVWVRDLTGQRLLWIDGEQLERGSVATGGVVRVGQLELGLRAAGGGRRAAQLATNAAAPLATSMGALRPGELVDGRYEVVSKLAVGGMGEVYRAQHAQLGKPVVLKVMKASLSDDPDIVARFKREAIAATRIGHQNIVDVSDFGRAPDGRFYFVMEYLEGVTLKRLLAQEGAQPLGRVVHLGLQIARALGAAHDQAIVHRDLKPENLMVLQREGAPDFVKVLDFGVAKVAPAPGEGAQTAFGMVMGTPGYMSPEQAQGILVDARSDLYSLGLILYELLSGTPTFTAETPSLLMFKQISEPPPPFTPELATRLPEALEALIFRMLAKAPADRPASMSEVVQVLEQTPATPAPRRTVRPPPVTSVDLNAPTLQLKATPARSAPVPGAPAPRSRLGLIVGGAVTLAALVVVGLVVARPSHQAVTSPAPIVEPAPVIPPAVAAEPAGPAVPPAVPTEEAAATTITLTFAVDGPPAEVFEGEVLLGRTPLPLSRERGAVATLTFSAMGFKPTTRRVRFESAQTVTIALERKAVIGVPPAAPLTRNPPPTGLKKNPFDQ